MKLWLVNRNFSFRMNKYILTLMDQNQSHQQNCENSHMFHLKKNLIILWQLIGYFFLFCVLVEMPYLVSLISFTPYFCMAFLCFYMSYLCHLFFLRFLLVDELRISSMAYRDIYWQITFKVTWSPWSAVCISIQY